jgi:1-acyl-sn-glycerol-3-phosphate acyltransferase
LRYSAAVRWLYPLFNVVQALFLAVWSAVWIAVALVVRIVTGSADASLAMARRFWAPGLRWIGRITIAREALPEGLDWSQPHVFVMNHQSMFDIVVAFIAIPVNIRFVAKQVLKYIPFLGWYMWATGMIFVDRGRRAQALKSLAGAGERIRAGASIIAYPEGTRSLDGRIHGFKKGSFMVALRAQVSIVPVAIEGSGRCLPKAGFRPRGGTVRVKIGQPIPTAGLTDVDRDALMHRVREALIDLHRSIGGAGGELRPAIDHWRWEQPPADLTQPQPRRSARPGT